MLAFVLAMDIISPMPRNPAGDGSITARMDNQCAEARSASPSTFTLSKGRNNRFSLLGGSSILSAASSLAERNSSPPPSYDGLTNASLVAVSPPEHDISAALDAHLPLQITNKGWSEVDFVSKQFIAENLPGWISSMKTAGDAHKPPGQQSQLSQLIKAGIRKSPKGLVLRLLRRTQDLDEIADFRLNAPEPKHLNPQSNPEVTALPELEACPPKTVHQVPGLHEVPADPPVYELPALRTLTPLPITTTDEREPDHPHADDSPVLDLGDTPPFSPSGDTVFQTLSFGPEEASAWCQPNIDTDESDRSYPSSIVPTPIKGLSVRGPIRHIVKQHNSDDSQPSTAAVSESGGATLDVDMLDRKLRDSSESGPFQDPTSIVQHENSSGSHQIQRAGPSTTESLPIRNESSQGTTLASDDGQSPDKISPDRVSPADARPGLSFPPVTDSSSPQSTSDGDRNSCTADRLVPRMGQTAKLSTPSNTTRELEDRSYPQHNFDVIRSTPQRSELARVVPVTSGRSEASPRLTISTDCSHNDCSASFIDASTNSSTSEPDSSNPSVQQSSERQVEPHSSASARRDTHSLSRRELLPSHSISSPGGTLDSVTLPTLNLPKPESPVGSMWLPSNMEIRPSPQSPNKLATFVSMASRAAFSQFLRFAAGMYERYGPERPVPRGHVRVRWTCVCGANLYDDFIEYRRGAARELEAYLNRPRAHSPSPSSSFSSVSSAPQIFSGPNSIGTPSPGTTWSSQGMPGDTSPYNGSPTALRSNNPFSVRIGTLPPERWLLACADEGAFTSKLSHVDVTETKIRSDKDLAMALRGLYFHVNRKWWRLLRLRGLTSINFVQFEVHRNRVVDIRKCPDMPPKQIGYDFEPHDLVPPVGNQYLMHLFLHPEDYDSEFITYARTPKKRNSKLDVGVGWGIDLVEGFLADRVWLLVMGVFVLSSSVFAIVWACKRDDDVQGAFGVASWMLTLAVLFVGWAQAALG